MTRAIKTRWTAVDVTLVNFKETRIIGKANVSFDHETERPSFITIEGHLFEKADLTHDGKLSYRHMKGCSNQLCQPKVNHVVIERGR